MSADMSSGGARSSGVVVGWGELLWDRFADGERLGGAPANVAFHAAQLGAQAALVSRVGDDSLGRRAVRALAEAGVAVGCIQVDAAAPTGTVEVEIVDGEPSYCIHADVAWDAIECDVAVGDLLRGARVLCFGTLALRTEAARAALHQALAVLEPNCVRLCDLNLRPPYDCEAAVDAAISAATVVKLSSSEVTVLAQRVGLADAELPTWLLRERGVELVAITRGAAGCAAYTPDATFEQPGHLVDVSGGDPVGAGDAFAAAVATALAHGQAAAAWLPYANRYAAYVASLPGAMPVISETMLAEIRANHE